MHTLAKLLGGHGDPAPRQREGCVLFLDMTVISGMMITNVVLRRSGKAQHHVTHISGRNS